MEVVVNTNYGVLGCYDGWITFVPIHARRHTHTINNIHLHCYNIHTSHCNISLNIHMPHTNNIHDYDIMHANVVNIYCLYLISHINVMDK